MKMQKFKYQYLLVGLGITLLSACASTKQVIQTSAEKTNHMPLEKSLLWEISGNGLKKPSYVFGTIHIIGKEDFFFPQLLEDKIATAEQAIFEIDMDDMSSMESMMKIIGKAFMQDGKSLKDLITEKEYAEVAAYFELKGLPLQMLERMKPMLLSTFATLDLGGEGGGMGDSKSYEMEIHGKVKEQKKSSSGLETVEDQLAIFDSIPYDAQAKMLLESIRSSKKENEEYKMMIGLYKKQDVDELARISVDGDSGVGGYGELFLFRRNRNWIPRMSIMMKEKSTFFAVGAGHLGGPKGVLNLLRKSGYKIAAIKMVSGSKTL